MPAEPPWPLSYANEQGSLLAEAWQKEKDGKQIREKEGKVNYSLKMHARLAPLFPFYTCSVPHPT